jgi:predicted nucleic acid-binding Zn ribbon protein
VLNRSEGWQPVIPGKGIDSTYRPIAVINTNNDTLRMTEKFCTGCGKPIEPDMQFCPQCGLVVSGSATDEEFKEARKQFGLAILESRRIWLIFLLAIYAIPVIISAIWALADASNIANAVWESDSFQKWIEAHGYSYTKADIQNYITYAAGMGLASGIFAAISLVCVYIRKYWIVAVIGCLMASVLCFWSFFGIIIGFLVTWMIFCSKEVFEANPDPEEL